MGAMTDSSREWIDGFLVVGNQPALDLLNTRLVADGQQQEMLTDTSALVRWLVLSGLAPISEIKDELKVWSGKPDGRRFLRELLIFRESLREAVLRLEDGKQPSPAFLADLNKRLFAHPLRRAIAAKSGKMQSRQIGGTSLADTLWAALLHETEKLFTDTEPGRVRKCESCIVQFLDVSKKNARRWCSMRLCGNRIKVAAYQDRQRRGEHSQSSIAPVGQ
jgi:predicted RNA-binding Zn ribbon-like protein